MPSAYRKTFGDLNHLLMYLLGNHCYRTIAIAPGGAIVGNK